MAGANRYTTTELLSDIRRSGHIPTAQTPFADADLLRLADMELQTAILRQILTVRENFYLTYSDTASDGSTTAYDIPTRAIGGGLADVQLISGTSVWQIARSEIGEQFSTTTSPMGVGSFYIKGNQVICLPAATTGSLRLWYYQRPNTLVPVASAAQVTAIASNVVTFGTLPATITTATPCDFIKDQPHFECRGVDLTPTVVTTTTLTFSSVPTTLQVGDWVALAGQTPVPQIPVEFRPLLVQRVVVKYYEIQGYLDKMSAAQKKLEAMEKDVMAAINPRVREEPKRIVSSSDLIGGTLRWRAWRST